MCVCVCACVCVCMYSVVMKSQPGVRAREDIVLLAGMSNGTVHVWNVELEGGR